MKKDSIKNIINTIKNDHITPKTIFAIRWKSYAFWFVWACIMIIGAISFSLMIVNVLDVRPEFFHHLGIGRYMRVLFVTAPYLWLFLVLVATVSGFAVLRKTHRGYRHSVLFFTSISVLAIMFLGAVVHMAKMNDRIGKGIADGGMPRGMIFPAEGRLQRPDHGLLGGRVATVAEDHLVITGFRGEQWTILYDENTQIDLPFTIAEGVMIEIVGEKIDEGNFRAKFIRPLPERMPRPSEEGRDMSKESLRYRDDDPMRGKIMP
ncbi:MAG: hypothetical protein WC819_00795 [Parcubacteria group bacterium]|jgi:hypothetical protein